MEWAVFLARERVFRKGGLGIGLAMIYADTTLKLSHKKMEAIMIAALTTETTVGLALMAVVFAAGMFHARTTGTRGNC